MKGQSGSWKIHHIVEFFWVLHQSIKNLDFGRLVFNFPCHNTVHHQKLRQLFLFICIECIILVVVEENEDKSYFLPDMNHKQLQNLFILQLFMLYFLSLRNVGRQLNSQSGLREFIELLDRNKCESFEKMRDICQFDFLT